MQTLSPVIRTVKARGRIVSMQWSRQTPAPHEFFAFACPEEEGGFSVFAANYPGVASQGETIEEAKANIGEAFLAMLAARRKYGEQMEFSRSPWIDIGPECTRLLVKVDG